MLTKDKPPTQGVGVKGFSSDLYGNDDTKILWDKLVTIPKFQMFACELSLNHHGDVMVWIFKFVEAQAVEKGERGFFDQYCAWHDQKGYWKQEDYYGNLL